MATKRIVIDGNTLTEILNVLVFKDDILRADLDEIKEFRIDNTEDTSDITGAGDVILNRTRKSKAVDISGTSGLLSGGLMELQTGGTQQYSPETIVSYSDTDNFVGKDQTTLTTDYAAIGTTNAEIGYLYVEHTDTGEGVRFEQAAVADATHFAYNPTKKIISLPTGDAIKEGDKVSCYYNIKVSGTKISNEATKFSTEGKVIVNCMAKDGCGVESRAQFIIPRCDFDGNFNISLGSDQTEHAFSAKAMKNKCKTSSNSTDSLWDFVVYKLPDITEDTGSESIDTTTNMNEP